MPKGLHVPLKGPRQCCDHHFLLTGLELGRPVVEHVGAFYRVPSAVTSCKLLQHLCSPVGLIGRAQLFQQLYPVREERAADDEQSNTT